MTTPHQPEPGTTYKVKLGANLIHPYFQVRVYCEEAPEPLQVMGYGLDHNLKIRDAHFLSLKLFQSWTKEYSPLMVQVDWDALPAWANNYVAMDADGLWRCYSRAPEWEPDLGEWLLYTGYVADIPEGYAPKEYHAPAAASLQINPKIKKS